MKWSKKWAAALLVAPTMYLASCGGSSNNNETTDTLTTQSAPPASGDSPSSKSGDTLTTVGEGGHSAASGNTDQSTTSPGNVAATGASSTGSSGEKKSTTSTTKKHKSGKKNNVSSAENKQPESKIPEVATEQTKTDSVTRAKDDADSSTINKSIMDTSSSVTKVDTTGEDMRNMDSTRADSNWNKNSNVGIPSTPDSVKSTMVKDSTTPAVADTTVPDKTADNSVGMNFTPSSFITTQIQNNYGEIKMARLAIDQASNPEVKSLAKTLENDHNQALRDLQDLSKDQTDLAGTLPTKESDSAREHITMMQNNRGSDFDKIWVSHMYQMHVRSVQTYELAQNQISDEELKAWITKILPKLREHRDKLEELNRNLSK